MGGDHLWEAIGAIGQDVGVDRGIHHAGLPGAAGPTEYAGISGHGPYGPVCLCTRTDRKMIDPATAALALKSFSDSDTFTEIEAWQCHSLLQAFILGSEEMFWLHDQGSLDEHAFNVQMAVLLQILGTVSGRASWELGKSIWTPAFQGFVEQKLGTLPRAAATPFLEVWNAARAAADQMLADKCRVEPDPRIMPLTPIRDEIYQPRHGALHRQPVGAAGMIP